MVDETQELPLEAEEPKPTAEAEPKENVEDLIAELEKSDIKTTQQLQGKLDASAQAGKAFQMLGDERKRVENLQAEVDRLKAQPVRESWDMPETQPVDIEAAIERGIDKTLSKREQVQMQAHQASIAAYNFITQDQNFHLVKDVWDEKIKNPGYLAQVQSGQINPVMDYQNTVVEYFQNVAQRSLKTIKELSGTDTTPPPHVESGESRSPGATANIVSEGEGVSANRQFLDTIKKKIAKGYIPTYEEDALMAEAVLAESPEV